MDELRAEYSRWIYWFTDSGIVRIQTVSFVPLIGSALAVWVLLATGAFFVVDLMGGSTDAILIILILGLGVTIAVPLLIPEVIRSRLLGRPFSELTQRKGSIQIPWQDVQKAKSKGGVITIWTSAKRYSMLARKNQAAMEDFLRNKIGDKLSA